MPLLEFDSAIATILSHVVPGMTETVKLASASGRTLSASFFSSVDLPPFDTSAVDGFAVKLPCPRRVRVTGEVRAGQDFSPSIGDPGDAVRVFTGSRLPKDVDAIVMQEDTRSDDDFIEILDSPPLGNMIRYAGEEIKRGAELLGAGSVITPPVLALLANSGNSQCDVYRRPRVTIIETGDELRSPGESRGNGEIFAANGIALSAAVAALGGQPTRYRCPDDQENLRETFAAAATENDVLITTGGISVGKFDLVRAAWTSLGAEEIFWRVAIRPGRPLYFAKAANGALIFGLPGNTVSSLVTFLLAVRPALLRFQDRKLDKWEIATTASEYQSVADVDIFARATLRSGVVFPIDRQGSHMSSGLAEANALVRVPHGLGLVPIGAKLPVMRLTW